MELTAAEMEGEKVDTAGPCVQKSGTLSYLDMVLGTLMSMEDTRTGVSRQKIVSYMRYLYPVKSNGMRFTKLLSNALNKGVEEGVLVQTAGSRGSGSFRLSKVSNFSDNLTSTFSYREYPHFLMGSSVVYKLWMVLEFQNLFDHDCSVSQPEFSI